MSYHANRENVLEAQRSGWCDAEYLAQNQVASPAENNRGQTTVSVSSPSNSIVIPALHDYQRLAFNPVNQPVFFIDPPRPVAG